MHTRFGHTHTYIHCAPLRQANYSSKISQPNIIGWCSQLRDRAKKYFDTLHVTYFVWVLGHTVLALFSWLLDTSTARLQTLDGVSRRLCGKDRCWRLRCCGRLLKSFFSKSHWPRLGNDAPCYIRTKPRKVAMVLIIKYFENASFSWSSNPAMEVPRISPMAHNSVHMTAVCIWGQRPFRTTGWFHRSQEFTLLLPSGLKTRQLHQHSSQQRWASGSAAPKQLHPSVSAKEDSAREKKKQLRRLLWVFVRQASWQVRATDSRSRRLIENGRFSTATYALSILKSNFGKHRSKELHSFASFECLLCPLLHEKHLCAYSCFEMLQLLLGIQRKTLKNKICFPSPSWDARPSPSSSPWKSSSWRWRPGHPSPIFTRPAWFIPTKLFWL